MNKLLKPLTKDTLIEAKTKYNFFETPIHHGEYIYKLHNPKNKLKIIDICCGMGSLVDPWYKNDHDITLIELNEKLIPLLKEKYPKANIINDDFLKMDILLDNYDVILCNPPFNNTEIKKVYSYFFCKILTQLSTYSTLYFICPKMWYTNQLLINIEHYENAKWYHNKFGCIELHSNEFRFNNKMIERMIESKIIYKDFIKQYIPNKFTIEPYYEFRYLRDIFDFETTQCKCGLFMITR